MSEEISREELKKRVVESINEHLMVDGPKNWVKLQTKHPEVSRPTLFRWIKEVRERIEDNASATGPESLRLAQKRIRSQVHVPDAVTEKIKAHLPVAPSPAVVAADPRNTLAAFDFFAFFGRIVQDAEMTRQSAVRYDEDGNEILKNPAAMDRSIARRISIIETYLQAVDAVYNAERLRELYEMIIEEVGKADTDLQQVVLARLRALNNRRGLTMAARP